MSYPNPVTRRRTRFRRADIAKFEICSGYSLQVALAVNALLKEGWTLHGDPLLFYSNGKVYAIQAMKLFKPEPPDEDEPEERILNPNENTRRYQRAHADRHGEDAPSSR